MVVLWINDDSEPMFFTIKKSELPFFIDMPDIFSNAPKEHGSG